MDSKRHRRSGPEVRVNGWKAILLVIAILGIVGYRFVSARSTLNSEGTEVLKTWISGEFQRYYLAQTELSQAEQARLVTGAADVEFRRVSARGSRDDIVVRVELEPSEFQPPGTDLVRFYRMEYSSVTGWRHKGDASPLSYYLKIL